MPIYSYKCTNCDHRFEVRQHFTDDPVTECPVCGSPVRKVITPVGIVFKGSGFYVTDNKNGKASSTLNGTGSTPTPKPKESEDKPASGTKPGPASSSKSKSESAGAASAA